MADDYDPTYGEGPQEPRREIELAPPESETAPVCDCYPGGWTYDTYEGPREDCPVHGRDAADA